MTDTEWINCVKVVNEAKIEAAARIEKLIYKYGKEENLPYLGDCIVIKQETLAVIFDILAPGMETDDENVLRYEPEDNEDDDIENE